MRILYVIDKMTNLAGIERILSCKMNYLSENMNHQVVLATYAQQGLPLAFPLNEKIIYRSFNTPMPQREGYSFSSWFRAHLNARKAFKCKFKSILIDVRPDIVIFTGYAYPILDIIIHTCRKLNIKTIMESHIKSDTVSMSRYVYNRTLHRIFSFWDARIIKSLRVCNCIVTLTHEDMAFWSQYGNRIEVIPNMITIIPQSVVDYKAKRIIAAGRYVYQKGYDLLLEAWHLIDNRFVDWHLYVYGNENKEPYQQIVDKYGMNKNVHLLPATEKIVEQFSKSSIYVMSSRFEGFPLVLGEAMSCGLPCVSFDCPHGPRDIISNEEDGLLVENGNVEQLARSLERLMADSSLRQAMGKRASINIMRYSPPKIMEKWDWLFRNI